jgi:hypothetical protein
MGKQWFRVDVPLISIGNGMRKGSYASSCLILVVLHEIVWDDMALQWGNQPIERDIILQGYDGIHRDIISPSTNIHCIDLIHQVFYGDVLWCMMEV